MSRNNTVIKNINHLSFLKEIIIIENEIKVYRDHICHCGCNERIHYPITKSGLENHTYYGIPKFIRYHYHSTDKSKKNQSEKRSQYIKEHPKETLKRYEKLSKYMKRYCLLHPEYIERLRKTNKSVSKSELIMQNYAIKLCKKHVIDYLLNETKIVGTPDMVILTNDGHPIALFHDGCHWHGCISCFPIDKISYDKWKYHAFKRHYDKMINEKLTEQGYRVIRIWEHDVKNGNYKQILRKLLVYIEK